MNENAHRCRARPTERTWMFAAIVLVGTLGIRGVVAEDEATGNQGPPIVERVDSRFEWRAKTQVEDAVGRRLYWSAPVAPFATRDREKNETVMDLLAEERSRRLFEDYRSYARPMPVDGEAYKRGSMPGIRDAARTPSPAEKPRFAASAVAAPPPSPLPLPIKEDFSAGLAGWTTAGNVASSGGTALLSDDISQVTTMYRAYELPVGSYVLEFDFKNGLSATYEQGRFPDAAFASLYFIDDPAAFNIESNSFAASYALMDLDFRGPFNVLGTVGSSVLGQEWLHYAGTFETTNAYTILFFELADLNGVGTDSTLSLDNVVIVPEPMAVVLFSAGTLLLLCRVVRRFSMCR